MWQVPDDLADRVRDTDYKDAWVREIERTAEVRGILTDLIAELRELNQDRDGGMWADDVHDCADRAEQRLREVSGE